MAKENLDQDGVNQKLQELYDLSDALLEVEADAIRADIIDWIDNNFNVTPEQESFLLSINNRAKAYLADTCAVAVKYRVPINFEPLPESSNAQQVRASKRVDIKNNIFTSFDVTGSSPVFTGTVDIVAAI